MSNIRLNESPTMKCYTHTDLDFQAVRNADVKLY